MTLQAPVHVPPGVVPDVPPMVLSGELLMWTPCPRLSYLKDESPGLSSTFTQSHLVPMQLFSIVLPPRFRSSIPSAVMMPFPSTTEPKRLMIRPLTVLLTPVLRNPSG